MALSLFEITQMPLKRKENVFLVILGGNKGEKEIVGRNGNGRKKEGERKGEGGKKKKGGKENLRIEKKKKKKKEQI